MGRTAKKKDGRQENDADWGVKYIFPKEGKRFKYSWFGFKIHIISDANYELPLGYLISKASKNDAPFGHKLVDSLAERHPTLIARTIHAIGDRGYDDTKLISKLWDKYGIKAVIDSRSMWQGDQERQLETKEDIDNVTYTEVGELHCCCPVTATSRIMPLGGFDHQREAIKYLCPAKHYGVNCSGKDQCPVSKGIRIPLKENKRIFTPLPRISRKWSVVYAKRTSVERIFSRLSISLGFDHLKIRGLEKVKLKSVMSLTAILALACGRAKQQNIDDIRKFTKAA
jgi:hypothetical protein